MVVSADNRGISVDPDRVKRKIGLKLFTLEQIIVLPWRFSVLSAVNLSFHWE